MEVTENTERRGVKGEWNHDTRSYLFVIYFNINELYADTKRKAEKRVE